MLRARTLAVGLALLAAACAQTDVVAIEENLCLHMGDCTADAVCSPRMCTGAGSGCDGGGPSVQVGDGCSDQDLEAQAFRFAVCSCSDYVSEFALTVDGHDAEGPVARAASVGLNGALTLGAPAEIDGSLQVGGMIANSVPANVSGSTLEYANPACNCQPQNLLDVATLVAAAERNNDNAADGVDPEVIAGFASGATLTLGCGRYHFPRVAGSGQLTVRVQGRAAMFVSGDLALDDGLRAELEPGATFELFVEGNVRIAGRLDLGTAADAPRVRTYVGGDGTINLEQPALLAGLLYAPRAELVTRASFESHGPLFVRRAAPGGDVTVHYDVVEAVAPDCGP